MNSCYFLFTRLLEQLTESLGHPNPKFLEIHGNAILGGRGWWRGIPRRDRRSVIVRGLNSVEAFTSGHWRLFGVVVEKTEVFPRDPVEYAFAQISEQFNQYLQRLPGNAPHMGLIVMDDTAYETRLQLMSNERRSVMRQSELINNVVDVPLFVDSKATRCIQYADLVAYAMWRKYERGDSEFFDIIRDWFDSEGGIVHGLHHYRNRDDFCDCPSCVSRQINPPLL